MSEQYKDIVEFLPSPLIARAWLKECVTDRSRSVTRISETTKEWVEKGILVPEKSFLESDSCILRPGWSGVYQFSDKKGEEPTGTRPSIGWDCNVSDCAVEADLPVAPEKEIALKNALKSLEGCCVHTTHTHEEGGVMEKHVHVICKGQHPSGIYATVTNLARLLLEQRGHEKAMQEWKEFR